jgi:hypothetical protein
MTPDSLASFSNGRENSFSDINSPLMSWIWGRFDSVVPGPALIFVMHLAIFWIAAALFWVTTATRSLWLGIALVSFGLMPHILAQTVVVWKDVALGVSLFMSVALLYFARVRESKTALVLSIVFLFYASAARLNALPAVLPIAIWSGFVALEIFDIEKRRITAALVGLGYFALLALGVYVVNGQLTEWKDEHPFQQIYLYDLAAISVERNEPVFPEYIRNDPNFSFEVVRARYNERSVGDLIFPNIPNRGDLPPLRLTKDREELKGLRDLWLDAVSADPMTYLKHRARIFAQLVGLSPAITGPYVAEGFANNPPEFRGNENAGYQVALTYFGLFRRPFPQTFFHRAVVWIIVCVVLGYLAMRRGFQKDWDLVFVLAASAVLFIAAYFPTTPSTEFRYLFWPAIASAVATIFGIYILRTERRGIGS